MKRRICIVTGTRAEYGLLYWLMRGVQDCEDLSLQVVATAMHLEPAFGYTVDHIRADGFQVDAELPIDLALDDPASIARATGRCVSGMADVYERLRPDIVVLLGDRFEALAAATAASLMGLPIAHIHGGEISEGAIDDAMRHAITKLSHLHFVATKAFARRVIQLGETPDRVFAVGAPGLDHFTRRKQPDRHAVSARLGLSLERDLLLVTYHPATLDERDPVAAVQELLSALDRFPDAAIVFTKANADAGGRAINAELERYVARHPERTLLVSSLGSDWYLATLMQAAAVVGNSSSGIIEAPAVDVPTVNIGIRQTGRPLSDSVINCSDTRDAIEAAVRTALDPAFRQRLSAQNPAYGRPGVASRQICEVLRHAKLDGILRKRFHDLPDQDES